MSCICQNGARVTCPVHGYSVVAFLDETEARHAAAGFAGVLASGAPLVSALSSPSRHAPALVVVDGGKRSRAKRRR